MSCDARPDPGVAGLSSRGTRTTERPLAREQTGQTATIGRTQQRTATAMKVAWLLAALLVTVLIASRRPRTRVVEPLPAPPVHRRAQTLDKAYRVAAAGDEWEALLEVADAARRAGELAGLPEVADAKAREIYRMALARARHQESLEGVLRVAEAFVAIGDQDGTVESLRIAEALAGQDPEARADIRALAAQLTAWHC
jgi:hypothetical protein